MAPKLNLNNLWVQERNPDILLLSLESPTNEPLQVRQRGPYGEKCSSTGHLHVSKDLIDLIKFSLIRRP